jgi:hypothetical protein
MAQLLCPRCQRANPGEAGYCHFDGMPLRLKPGQAQRPPGTLPHEFVFPSGRACRTFDELVQGCQEEWSDARRLLQQGVFAQYLAGAGRMDLAAAAQKAQAHADPDIGLHVLISALPASKQEGPRLDLKPRRLALGSLRVGETRQVRLTVANLGKGLLQGTLTVATGEDWLRIPGSNNGHCTLKTAREQQVNLLVDARQLAAKQKYSAKLTVITNGGIVEVPVALEVAAVPFARPPFQGAGSPREMAERMRTQPKPAVSLLENGEVARWFTANGWVYPVPASTARGVAAVQQFFEGMGLSKPPPLQLSEEEARLTCTPPEVAEGQVTLQTTVRKWVYATADCDVPWMRVTTPAVSGPQQAVITYEVDSGLLDEGRLHEGRVRVLANAGQRLEHRVFVDVRRPQEPFTRRLLRPFLAGLLLAFCFRLLVGLPADVYARVLAANESGAGSFRTWLESPLSRPDQAGPYVRHFVLATWWLGAVAGGTLLWRRSGRWPDVPFGIVAGAVAGVLGGATFACLLPLADEVPRLVWHVLGAAVPEGLRGPPWLWTPAWVGVAAASWAVLGGAVGLLRGALRGSRSAAAPAGAVPTLAA